MRTSFKTALDRVPWSDVAEVWRVADELNIFDAGWVNDHFQDFGDDFYGSEFKGPRGAHGSFTALSALAATTQCLRLGVMVSPVALRSPISLLKAAVTVDHVSNGRLELGVGAGWHQGEHEDYGVELLPPGKRLDRFEEALAIISGLLAGEEVSFDGEYYAYRQAKLVPLPVQHHLPIVIGGSGEKRTLPLTARFADHWNFEFSGRDAMPETFRKKSELLSELAITVGRDPAHIERSVQIPLVRGVDKAVDLGRGFSEAGADHIIYFLRPPLRPALLEELATALDL